MKQPAQIGGKVELLPTTAVLWNLLLTLWLGAHLATLLFFLPLLEKVGFAPLLQQEVTKLLKPGLLVITILTVAVQLLIQLRCYGFTSVFQQLRGQLLLAIWLISILLIPLGQHFAGHLIVRVAYGIILGCGLLLLTQPAPQTRVRQ